MSNPERGEVTLDAGGTSYRLRLTLNAMCELEDALSTPEKPVTFLEVLGRLRRSSAKDIRWIVWAALREHHPEMTLKDAGELVQEAGGLFDFAGKLQTLTASAEPDPEDVKALGVDTASPRLAQAKRGAGGASSFKRAKSA